MYMESFLQLFTHEVVTAVILKEHLSQVSNTLPKIMHKQGFAEEGCFTMAEKSKDAISKDTNRPGLCTSEMGKAPFNYKSVA